MTQVAPPRTADPILLAVMANRMESICREMMNTLLRSARSAVINQARDFSCSIVTADNELLASAEGLPVHVIGSEFLAEAMTELHTDLADGDAYLHNDPYLGNTHSADAVRQVDRLQGLADRDPVLASHGAPAAVAATTGRPPPPRRPSTGRPGRCSSAGGHSRAGATRGKPVELGAEQPDLTVAERVQADHGLDQGRLAGAVRPQQRDHLATVDGDVDLADDRASAQRDAGPADLHDRSVGTPELERAHAHPPASRSAWRSARIRLR